jgi:O-antigen/teichoic acid export membrane protein
VTRLRNNIIANFGGRAWAVLMGVAFVPIYIHILGIEAYGLIGFFLSLQAFFFVLDMGLSATLNRELARYTHSGANANEKRNLVRTLEWLYWPVGLLIAIGIYILSEPIATHWLKPVSLSVEQAAHAIALMGLAAALQWPCGFYAGGFRGLERQVALNGINAFFSTLRSVGAVGILLYYSPTLEAFLWWQIIVAILQTLVSGGLLWHLLPSGDHIPRFQRNLLYKLRGFALGMTGIVALSFVLTQSDKIILSTLLPLDEFGYYTLAATVAAALSAAVQPFFIALYPRFSGLVAIGDRQKLIALYHRSNQLLAIVVVSVAAVLAFFAVDVLRLWTHNLQLATKSGPILSILVAGTALNGLMNLPYALQLAYGWTRLSLYQNLVAVVLVVPAIWWLGHRFGGIGAAAVWVALNLGYVLIGIPLMHRKLLHNEMATWYQRDILPPTLTAIAIAGTLRVAIPAIPAGLGGIVVLGLIGLATLGTSALTTPASRYYACSLWGKIAD